MVVTFLLGLGWNSLRKQPVAPFLTGVAIAHPWSRAKLWQGVVWTAPRIWAASKILASDSLIIGRAATGTRTAAALGSGATIVAAVGVGYTVGAVTGTVIVSQAEERELVYEGATADVLDFYTGEGQYWAQGDDPTPGYFNIPGNVKFIATTYWDRWTKD